MGAEGQVVGAREAAAQEVGEALPAVLYVPDLAGLLRISEKALRQRVARGQVPRPFKSGKALAWTREVVVLWLRDCGRSTGPPAMKIKLRPYAHDPTRFQLDIRFMHPVHTTQEIRRRLVAPAGLDLERARQWGAAQVPALVREVLEEDDKPEPVAPPRAAVTPKEVPPRPPASPTLEVFYDQRFEPEYVQLQKPGTQVAYDSIYRNHIRPALGNLRLTEIDDARLLTFRAQLRKTVKASTTNMMLGKLARILRYARKVHALQETPEVEKLELPRAKKKRIYSEEELGRLLAAAETLGTEASLVCLLALDAGLRVSEICALEWADIDPSDDTVTIQNNVYRGVKQTPKGTIGTLALTATLNQALARHRAAGDHGPLVLYRKTKHTAWQYAPHTPHSVVALLNQVQRAAGLPVTGPHYLRHTALTRLAKLGANIYVVQAVARHSRLQTTQTYLHLQQVGLTREAAQLFDRASPRFGKSLAKPPTPPNDRV